MGYDVWFASLECPGCGDTGERNHEFLDSDESGVYFACTKCDVETRWVEKYESDDPDCLGWVEYEDPEIVGGGK